MLSINKPVTLVSSDGAAATVIDARTVGVATNVLIITGVTGGGEFGRPGKGFTVTQGAGLGSNGIAIDSIDVSVRGNEVVGWTTGIRAEGTGKTVRKNQVSLNSTGIVGMNSSAVVQNVATANTVGIDLIEAANAVGNAVNGNRFDGFRVFADSVNLPFTGSIAENNVVGNGLCGVRKSGKGDVLAARNYWGAATGPGNAFIEALGHGDPRSTGASRMMRAVSHDRPLALPDVSNSTH